jgi:hypothetical protein
MFARRKPDRNGAALLAQTTAPRPQHYHKHVTTACLQCFLITHVLQGVSWTVDNYSASLKLGYFDRPWKFISRTHSLDLFVIEQFTSVHMFTKYRKLIWTFSVYVVSYKWSVPRKSSVKALYEFSLFYMRAAWPGPVMYFEFIALHQHVLKGINFEVISYAVFFTLLSMLEPSWRMCNNPRSMMSVANFLSKFYGLTTILMPYFIVNQRVLCAFATSSLHNVVAYWPLQTSAYHSSFVFRMLLSQRMG